MSIVLGKFAHPHQPHERAGSFITVYHTEFGHTQRQVAVRFNSLLVNQQTARAVHRLNAKLFVVFGFARIVVSAVFIPVAGSLPQAAVHNARRCNFDIAVVFLAFAHIFDQLTVDFVAFVMPENRTRGIFRFKMEQIHFFAELAVIAFFGFFQHFQISFQIFFVGPGRCINALQHLFAGIAAPISAGNFHQFECIADFSGRRNMGTAAKIGKVTLSVKGNNFIFRQILNNFGLIMFSHIFEELDGFVTRHNNSFDLFVTFNDFVHFLFDFGKILRRKRFFAGKIVIKAVFNSGAYGNLNVFPQFFDGFGHHM